MSTSHLDLLGCQARDKVTGVEGVITSVSYDLYGCIQAVLTLKSNEQGEYKLTCWMDVIRFEVLNDTPVIERPNFESGYVAEGKKGSAEKPTMW